ncbi:secreted RxLR effector protein 161-like [Manihot esculenta]|uniref:secreted RxLR effector protein 161-like n=1 Tax=Manihot esculenta TaxID=3983 RepID=UPI001CC6429E|nr:secreted RxLR effector protein 161-like [Manihot esculenta]
MGVKPCSTPIIPNICLTKNDGDPYNDPKRYRRLVGKPNYLMVMTWPDIAFAVSIVSQFMSAPMLKHWTALEQILCYLKWTLRLGILYRDYGHIALECFSDADWAGFKSDRRSTICYCVFIGGNLVSWKSKKQNVIFRSSAELEYRVMAQSTCEILWINHLLKEVSMNVVSHAKL